MDAIHAGRRVRQPHGLLHYRAHARVARTADAHRFPPQLFFSAIHAEDRCVRSLARLASCISKQNRLPRLPEQPEIMTAAQETLTFWFGCRVTGRQGGRWRATANSLLIRGHQRAVIPRVAMTLSGRNLAPGFAFQGEYQIGWNSNCMDSGSQHADFNERLAQGPKTPRQHPSRHIPRAAGLMNRPGPARRCRSSRQADGPRLVTRSAGKNGSIRRSNRRTARRKSLNRPAEALNQSHAKAARARAQGRMKSVRARGLGSIAELT